MEEQRRLSHAINMGTKLWKTPPLGKSSSSFRYPEICSSSRSSGNDHHRLQPISAFTFGFEVSTHSNHGEITRIDHDTHVYQLSSSFHLWSLKVPSFHNRGWFRFNSLLMLIIVHRIFFKTFLNGSKSSYVSKFTVEWLLSNGWSVFIN